MSKRIAIVLVALLFAGCATTRLTNVWRDDAARGAAVKHVLVVGYGDDGASRRIFEEEFVRVVRAAGVAATASHTLAPGVNAGEMGDVAKVKELAARAGADAVLATRLLSVEQRVNVYPGQLLFAPSVTYRRHLQHWDAYPSTTVVMASPPSSHEYTVTKLETSLWRGDRLLWSATSETYTGDDARKTAAEFAGVIVAALRENGML